jgi:N-acyl-phosphatidylethanolamine-hydrolysing phospholipase D
MSAADRRSGKLIAAVLTALLLAACSAFEFAPRRKAAPPHHGRKSFLNIPPGPTHTLGAFLRCYLGWERPDPPAVPPELLPRVFVPETTEPDMERVRNPDPEEIQVTWIGHSSFLIQAAGLNILADPVFSRRASPLAFTGPVRLAPPGIEIGDLPRIDAVLISHNHYDHLDKRSLRALGGEPRIFVPLGHRRLLASWGLHRVSELDWWQTATLGRTFIHAVPARHNSNRGLFDADRALWAGWVIAAGKGSIYFAGDTGYGPHFLEIGRRLGPVRLALLPIGAYAPRRLIRPVHIDPAEAVRAHLDLGAEVSVAMHWGTFALSPTPPSEPMAEPPLYLLRELEAAGLDAGDFRLMKIGETARWRW